MDNVDVVLVRPEKPGNVGSVARAMKNFGFTKLVLVEPCELTEETRAQAKHAYDVVRNARVLKKFNAKDYSYVVGTTGIVGAERQCISPTQVKKALPKGPVAILFGNEGRGLSKAELQSCDVLVHIQTAEDYAVMNLSHAVAIVLYELCDVAATQAVGRKERDALVYAFINTLDNLDYPAKEDAKNTLAQWLNRVPPTRQEAATLLGAFKRIEKRLKETM